MEGTAVNAFALLSTIIFAMHSVSAYPQGPPLSTCLSQFPKHGLPLQEGLAPFQLVLSPATYIPGQNITVRLTTTENSRNFTGFQVTAHRPANSSNPEEFIGTFSMPDNSTALLNCLGSPASMIAHKDGNPKSMIEAIWTAPNINVGNLQFLVTVVENYTTYWYKMPTDLQAGSTDDVVPPQETVPSLTVSTTQAPDWTTCDSIKGCWFVPMAGSDSCNGNDCQAAMSYRKRDDGRYAIELSVKGQNQYISVGLSEDKLMGHDQVMMCTGNTDHESVQVGYNYGSPGSNKFYDRQYTRSVSDLVAGHVDGNTYCSFTCSPVMTSLTMRGTNSTQFDLSNEYYLFLAWGNIYYGTETSEMHTAAPAISEKKVDLSAVKSTSAADIATSKTLCVFTLTAITLQLLRL